MTKRADRKFNDLPPSPVLLTLVAPAAFEDSVADLLLEAPEITAGFTSSAASGHGSGLRFESASERVHGRGRQVRFELALHPDVADAVLARLAESLASSNVYYWICPMMEYGTLAEHASRRTQP